MRTVSTTQLKTLQCPRRWYFQYKLGYEPKGNAESLMFGSAFHAGMATALLESRDVEDIDVVISRAIIAANVDLDEQLFDLDANEDISETDMRLRLSSMFEYYLPLIGLGTKYRVAEYWEVMGADECPDCGGFGMTADVCAGCAGKGRIDEGHEEYECPECFGAGHISIDCDECHAQGCLYDTETSTVEHEFHINMGEFILHGIVDAFLYDLETDEIVIVDWKTASTPRNATQAMLDDQLHLYAAAFNHLGANIQRVIMWQFRKDVPKPAKINKDGKPSIANQTSTWDVWYASLPPAAKKIVDDNKDEWLSWAAEKLNPDVHFNAPIENFITEASCDISKQNIQAQVDLIDYIEGRIYHGYPVPANASGGFSGICNYCPFQTVCVDAIRNGEDYQQMLNTNFTKRLDS